MPADTVNAVSRRHALKCLAYGGAGTLFTLAGGVLTPVNLARATAKGPGPAAAGIPLFVQISDTHIGFSKDANPDVAGTLTQTVELFNAMPDRPDMVIHTGDITHLSKPAEFDTAALLLSKLRVTELHTTPGEHDVADATASEYFSRYGKPSGNRAHAGAGQHDIDINDGLPVPIKRSPRERLRRRRREGEVYLLIGEAHCAHAVLDDRRVGSLRQHGKVKDPLGQ